MTLSEAFRLLWLPQAVPAPPSPSRYPPEAGGPRIPYMSEDEFDIRATRRKLSHAFVQRTIDLRKLGAGAGRIREFR